MTRKGERAHAAKQTQLQFAFILIEVVLFVPIPFVRAFFPLVKLSFCEQPILKLGKQPILRRKRPKPSLHDQQEQHPRAKYG